MKFLTNCTPVKSLNDLAGSDGKRIKGLLLVSQSNDGKNYFPHILTKEMQVTWLKSKIASGKIWKVDGTEIIKD